MSISGCNLLGLQSRWFPVARLLVRASRLSATGSRAVGKETEWGVLHASKLSALESRRWLCVLGRSRRKDAAALCRRNHHFQSRIRLHSSSLVLYTYQYDAVSDCGEVSSFLWPIEHDVLLSHHVLPIFAERTK